MPIYREFDKNFFKKWSKDMAYILGFLFADGNIIRTKRNTHFVSINTADYELLHSMMNLMKSNHKISERRSEKGIWYRVQIGSKELFNDLIRLGLTPNKSRRMELPKIPKKYFGDFIRGYFDGDGNVWMGLTHKKRRTSTSVIFVAFTCASTLFLRNLHKVLKRRGILGGCEYLIKSKRCCRLSFSTLDSLKIYEIMYNDPHRLFLSRKKLVFEKFIKMRS